MKFKILSEKGDAAFDYDVATAEIKFNELKESNLLPVVVSPEGTKRALTKFEPDVDEIMWVSKIVGG